MMFINKNNCSLLWQHRKVTKSSFVNTSNWAATVVYAEYWSLLTVRLSRHIDIRVSTAITHTDI
jgi:hypothetical protein